MVRIRFKHMDKYGELRQTPNGRLLFIPHNRQLEKRYDERTVEDVLNSGDRTLTDYDSCFVEGQQTNIPTQYQVVDSR